MNTDTWLPAFRLPIVPEWRNAGVVSLLTHTLAAADRHLSLGADANGHDDWDCTCQAGGLSDRDSPRSDTDIGNRRAAYE